VRMPILVGRQRVNGERLEFANVTKGGKTTQPARRTVPVPHGGREDAAQLLGHVSEGTSPHIRAQWIGGELRTTYPRLRGPRRLAARKATCVEAGDAWAASRRVDSCEPDAQQHHRDLARLHMR